MDPDYTRLLNASTVSNDGELFAGLYAELKKIAAGRMAAERQGGTLNATALVHEAWLRVQNSAPEKWRDRKQFFAAAADWATKMRANPKAPARGTAAAAAVLAMAEHQRKHPAAAAKALTTAQTTIAANWPAGTEGPWHAWLIADLLAKEAGALIEAQK